MKQSLNILQTNLKDIVALLDLSLTLDSVEQKRGIFRSAVVLLIASWEQYIEQLAESSVSILTARLRDSSPLPENVKQKIAMFSVTENKRNNERKFSDSVWLFADKGWKDAYIKYCGNLTLNLNTASPSNVRDLYMNILGIRNVTSDWHFLELTTEECVTKSQDLVGLRHDIAHGANARQEELEEANIREQTEFIASIAKCTLQTIFHRTADLSHTQAIEYSLSPACF